MSDTTAPRTACLNCGATLVGAYCGECGQRNRDPDVSIGELASEAVESFTNVDGTVLRSFRGLVWPPGRLTAEYLNGRRATYLPPLRLYLLCSLAFVAATALKDRLYGGMERQLVNISRTTEKDDGSVETIRGDSVVKLVLDSTSAVSKELGNGMWGRFVRQSVVDPAGFRARVRKNASRAFFALVPSFALLLSVAFRKKRWAFPKHLVVALHVHAMGFVLFATSALLGFTLYVAGLADAIALVAILVLTAMSLRHVYGTTTRGTLGRMLAIVVPYLLVVGVATVAVMGAAAFGS